MLQVLGDPLSRLVHGIQVANSNCFFCRLRLKKNLVSLKVSGWCCFLVPSVSVSFIDVGVGQLLGVRLLETLVMISCYR